MSTNDRTRKCISNFLKTIHMWRVLSFVSAQETWHHSTAWNLIYSNILILKSYFSHNATYYYTLSLHWHVPLVTDVGISWTVTTMLVPYHLHHVTATQRKFGCPWTILRLSTQIAKFMGPTWGPPGADRTQVGPMLAPWNLLSGCFQMSYRRLINRALT